MKSGANAPNALNEGSSRYGVQEQALPPTVDSGQSLDVGDLSKLWVFLARHPFGAVFFTLGAALNIYGIASDGMGLYDAGLKGWVIQAIGAALFFVAVATMLFRWSAENTERTASKPARKAPPVIPMKPSIPMKPTTTAGLMTNLAPRSAPDFPGRGLMTGERPAPPEPKPSAVARLRHEGAAAMQGSPAMERWQKVGSFELFQAAALWNGETPPQSSLLPLSLIGQANLAMLKAAIADRELIPEPPQGLAALTLLTAPEATEKTRVARENLVAFARQIDEFPPFLFPDSP